MPTEQPRHGEQIVNTHTGVTKPDNEPFDPKRHGLRCYHRDDVSEGINHWGTFNGRDRDKQAALSLISAMETVAGRVFETFHIEMYVAVVFADRPDTIGAFIHTGFIDTTVQSADTQFSIERGYWRHEFTGYGGGGSATRHAGAQTVVPHAECHCSPGFKAPVGSDCPYCGESIVADPKAE